MSIRLAAAALLLAAVPVAAHAGDFAMPQMGSGDYYVQVLGGAVAPGRIDYYQNGTDDGYFDGSMGVAIAGTAGVVVMDNLAVEGDVMFMSRNGTIPPDPTEYSVTSMSAMVNVKALLPINDMFTLYGAAGAGLMSVKDNYYTFSGPAYQLIGGASAKVAGNVSVVGELRVQNFFGRPSAAEYSLETINAPTVTALFGVKLSF